MPNKPARGGTWTPQEVAAVWRRGTAVPGLDPNLYRRDICGALMELVRHGDTTPGGGGWEVDHKVPVARGGTDDLDNLQPLQWENNRSKGDQMAGWACARTR